LRRPGAAWRGGRVEGGREEEREEGVSAGVSAGGGEDGSEEEVRAELREAEMAVAEMAVAERGETDRGEAEVAVAERGEEGQEWKERSGTKRVRVRVRRGGRVKRGLWWKSLAMVAGCGVIGWAGWRGGVNLGVFPGVKARELAVEAMKHQVADDEKKASELLERAVELDGDDPVVLRALVDLNAPRRNNAALPALKRLLGRKEVDESDLERAARVAVEWERLELAPVEMLQRWSEAVPREVPLARLVLSGRWLMLRGEHEEAERRLRVAAAGGGADGAAELALCEVLLRPGAGGGDRMNEGLERLERLIEGGERPLGVRQRAVELMAEVVRDDAVRARIDGIRLERLRGAFAPLVARLDPEPAVACLLDLHSVELAVEPESRPEVFGQVMEEFMPLDEKLKLTIARWFLNSGAGDRALAIYEGNPKWGEPGAWEAMRVEVPLQGGDYDAAREAVGKVAWLLTGVKRAGFRYRIAAGRGGEDELSDSRMQLLKAAEADGDPEEVREEAEYAEARGDRELAIGLYNVLEKDPEEEVFAKLEVAKLQSAKVEGRAGAMAVLESLLSGWPRLEEVRNRLIRMRLLEGRGGSEDVAAALVMAAGVPGYAPFQVTAALARLVSGQPKEALELLEKNGGKNRREAEVADPLVSVVVLAAGGRKEDARKVREAMGGKELTAGEKALLERWMPAGR
jgi:hypothetical protein